MTKTKINDKTSLRKSLCQVYTGDKTGISTEPGLITTNAVVQVDKKQRFQLMITNSTNKIVKLKRGCVLVKIEPVDECNLTTAFQGKIPKTQPVEFSSIKDKIIVSNEHKKEIEQLIKYNLELFAEKDTNLGCTYTAKMTIDTGNHAPIKQRPFHTPLTKGNIIEKGVRDIFKANII